MSVDVFVSYSRFDHAIAGALAAAMQAQGLRVWWDSQLTPADDVELTIRRVLQETRAVVAVLSPRSMSSDWVTWELAQAREGGICIVPVLVEGAHVEDLPASIGPLHAFVLPFDHDGAVLARAAARVLAVLDRSCPPDGSQQVAAGEGIARDARRRLAVAAMEATRDGPAPKPLRTKGPPRSRVHTAAAATDHEASPGLIGLLERLDVAIAFASRRSGALHLIGRGRDGGIAVREHPVRGTMSVAAAGDTLWVAGLEHIFRLRPAPRFEPASAHYTGMLDAHDVTVTGRGQVVFANTRHSCLSRLSAGGGVEAIWAPGFISEIVDEDRCHLNGLALRDGEPAYVTCVSRSDTPQGWRTQRADGGVVVDVRANRIVAGGLSMPHSPRFDAGRLWLLHSGRGELGFLEGLETGRDARFVPVASCPGYTRGLAIRGRYAFVGVSHPRHEDYAGLPLDHTLRETGAEPWCGIRIIDIVTGGCVAWLRSSARVGEIHGVALLPGARDLEFSVPSRAGVDAAASELPVEATS